MFLLTHNFYIVSMFPEPQIHVSEVSMNMVSMPVKRVMMSAQVIPGEVAARIPETVELIPEEPSFSIGYRYYFCSK